MSPTQSGGGRNIAIEKMPVGLGLSRFVMGRRERHTPQGEGLPLQRPR